MKSVNKLIHRMKTSCSFDKIYQLPTKLVTTQCHEIKTLTETLLPFDFDVKL